MESPIVQVTEGKLQGTSRTDWKGNKFYSFFSIPYAKPPTGNLRFKAPQPAEPWKGVLDATKQGNICVQATLLAVGGSEDCLNLHVFTKTLPTEEQKLKPVMVFIHGGGFTMGSHDINMLGPDFIMSEDVVLVSITYRLGLLGFLSLQDTSLDVPGNAGLKDQVQALKWIQQNIKYFNGDSNNVTIFGISAGSVSVEYLLLSPTAKNLFHKAILHSGSTLNPWGRGLFDAADFANYLGHPNINDKEILKMLTEMTAFDLYNAQVKYQQKVFSQDFGLIGPVIEKPNKTAFITKHPMEIIQSGEYNAVPVIMGYVDNEGLLFEFMKFMRKARGIDMLKDDSSINHLLPRDTEFKNTEQVEKITNILNEFYGSDKYKSQTTLLQSDGFFVIGILTSAINQANVSKYPVYLYRFSFVGELNMIKNMARLHHFPGAAHGDCVSYLFNYSQSPFPSSEHEKNTVQRMVKMWTNFAKYTDPVPPNKNDLNVDWKPIKDGVINFLDIGKELVPGVNPEEDRLKLWKEVYGMNTVTAKFF